MKIQRQFRGNYVQGQFLKITDPNGEIQSRSPGDLEKTPATFPFSYEQLQEAVTAARQSFASWKRMPASDRYSAIVRYRQLLAKRSEEVAEHITFEIGKPLWESRDEIKETLTLIDYFLNLGSQTTAEVKVSNATEDSTGRVRFLSRGVAAVVPPANLPMFTSHSHLIPALMHGNTVVLKPSRLAPMVGQCIAEIGHDSGIPAGVLNVIHGDAEVSRRLCSHPDVDLVLFTGTYETGFKIRKQLVSDYWKVLVLEMGGKNGLVVWDDCDYKKALHEALMSTFITAGQRCTSASRILIHDKIFDRFVDDFHTLAKKCRVGNGFLEGEQAPFMGPLISEPALENYLRYQGIAVREGCEEIMRGKTLERETRGYFVSPSIHWVKNLDPKSVYQKNEIHGPNAALYRVRDLDEVTEILNQTQFGLVSTIYTASRENYSHLAEEVRVGLFHWNQPTIAQAYCLPYGGVRKSGNARPMGNFSGYQCTFPVSSLEFNSESGSPVLPVSLPKLS